MENEHDEQHELTPEPDDGFLVGYLPNERDELHGFGDAGGADVGGKVATVPTKGPS